MTPDPHALRQHMAAVAPRGLRWRLPDLLRALLSSRTAPDPGALARRIHLPVLTMSDEERLRATHRDQGQKLVRQDSWKALSDLIRHSDGARFCTPGGASVSTLVATGARHDVVAAAVDALRDGTLPDPAGLAALEDICAEAPQDYPRCLVAALAHLDVARAWQAGSPGHSAKVVRLRLRGHLRRAAALLAPFDATTRDAPSLAVAQAQLATLQQHPATDPFGAWDAAVDLDPDCPQHMRAFGLALWQAGGQDAARIEMAARRCAARTADVWGAGGYVWVLLDVLIRDPRALAPVRTGLFLDGLHDIVDRWPDAHVINLLTAFCAVAMAAPAQGPALPVRSRAKRARLHAGLRPLAAQHLHELHPLVWARVAMPDMAGPERPARRALALCGRQTALRALALGFARDLAGGGAIGFSPAGMYRLPAT